MAGSRRHRHPAGALPTLSPRTSRIPSLPPIASTASRPAISSTRAATALSPTYTEITVHIPCPYCGERDRQEFSYLGDATKTRPNGLQATERAMLDYVYVRDNPAGPHREFWHHVVGCNAWLVVT